jgi:hypothetical protein
MNHETSIRRLSLPRAPRAQRRNRLFVAEREPGQDPRGTNR